MATLDDDFAFVAASVQRTTLRQRSACDLILKDSKSSGLGLARHLDFAYEAIDRHVTERRSNYAGALDDTVREDAIVEMRQLLWDVRKLQDNLEWISAAKHSPLDLGTRFFVEDISRALIAPKVELTVVSGAKQSYATTSDPWEPLIKAWGNGIPKDEPTIIVVFLPRREESAGLLHPLIVHELGHAADAQHHLVDAIWKKAQKRVRLSNRFARAVSNFQKVEKLDALTARKYIAYRLRAWIAEALCDSIAVHHLGPSYLYSFMVEVLAGNLDDPTPRHPPPRQRIRHMMSALDRLGWTVPMRKGDAKLDAWVRSWAETRVQYEDVEGFLYWAIDELLPVIRSSSQALLKNHVFRPDPSKFVEVEKLLAADIPPAQRLSGEPIAREEIILACWYAALTAAGSGPKALPDAAERPELDELLPAALELSALTQAWESAP